jgi:hypothetical protein
MNSWKVVEINEEQYGNTIPYVSIGHNRLAFNKAACDLIGIREGNLQYAHFLRTESNPSIIGIRFRAEGNERELSNSVPIIQKEVKGKPVGGIDIANSILLRDIFGKVVTKSSVTRFRVRKDETFSHFLVVDLKTSIGKK